MIVGELPPVGPLIPFGGDDATSEDEVAAQIEPVSNELEIRPDLRLSREALGPDPFLLDLFVE